MITPGINPAAFVWGPEHTKRQERKGKKKMQLPTECHQTSVNSLPERTGQAFIPLDNGPTIRVGTMNCCNSKTVDFLTSYWVQSKDYFFVCLVHM